MFLIICRVPVFVELSARLANISCSQSRGWRLEDLQRHGAASWNRLVSSHRVHTVYPSYSSTTTSPCQQYRTRQSRSISRGEPVLLWDMIHGSKWKLSLIMEMNIIKSQHYIVDDLSPCLFSCLPFEHKMLENVCLGKSPIIQKENICKLRFLKTVFWVTLTMVAVSLKILLYEKKRVWMNECLTIQKTNRQWYLYIEDLKKPARQAGKT